MNPSSTALRPFADASGASAMARRESAVRFFGRVVPVLLVWFGLALGAGLLETSTDVESSAAVTTAQTAVADPGDVHWVSAPDRSFAEFWVGDAESENEQDEEEESEAGGRHRRSDGDRLRHHAGFVLHEAALRPAFATQPSAARAPPRRC